MSVCIKCQSSRTLYVVATSEDQCYTELDGNDTTGSIPFNYNIRGKYNLLEFTVCADCGHMVGEWPLPTNESIVNLEKLDSLHLNSSDDELTISSKLNSIIDLLTNNSEEEDDLFVDIDYQHFPEGHFFITGSDQDEQSL